MSMLDQPLTAPIPTKPGSHVITEEWLLAHLVTNKFEKPQINWLNANTLIYTLPYTTYDKQHSGITTVNIRTGERQLLGEGSTPVPSPDHQWIAFIRQTNTMQQLWLMRSDGTQAKPITTIEGGLTGFYNYHYGFTWAPDSKQIALHHQSYLSPQDEITIRKRRKSLTNMPKSIIEIVEVANGNSHHVLTMDAILRSLCWLPNGKQLLFVQERPENFYPGSDEAWIKTFSLHNRKLGTVARFNGLQQFLSPACSKDGKQVAFTNDADNPVFNFMPSLSAVSLGTLNETAPPEIKRLTHELKLDSPQWSLDSSCIYVRRDCGAYKQIYAIDAATGNATQITNAPLNVETYALSHDGRKLAWIGQDAHGTRIIKVSNHDGCNTKNIVVIPSVTSDIALSEVREIDWKSADYPTRMRGLLFLPLTYQEGTRYPLVVDIHGGGSGAHIYLYGGLLVSTPLEWQLWTAKGYAVFVPEFRSSASFGSRAITDSLRNHDRLNGDMQDILAGTDELITQGIIDSQRIAIIGHSAGGLLANWLAVSTHHFRAIISKEGWADEWISALKYRHALPKRFQLLYGGTPLQVPKNYLKNSALFHGFGVSTPTLFCMGNPKLGGIDLCHSSYMLYLLLKLQGVESQYIVYPDEGHVFERCNNLGDLLRRSVQWIDKHIGELEVTCT